MSRVTPAYFNLPTLTNTDKKMKNAFRMFMACLIAIAAVLLMQKHWGIENTFMYVFSCMLCCVFISIIIRVIRNYRFRKMRRKMMEHNKHFTDLFYNNE